MVNNEIGNDEEVVRVGSLAQLRNVRIRAEGKYKIRFTGRAIQAHTLGTP